MLEIGSYVDGKYKILHKIGQGGMSVVYLAVNERANKHWAIKEIRKDGMKDFQTLQQSLIVETELLKKLRHPSLPSIVDIIDDEDSFLIVMDYIEGQTLSQTLEKFGPQPEARVIYWAKQLCDVLGYLHSRIPAIVYRDMKPGNIMLKPDGTLTLIDFGTAREFKERSLDDTTCLGTVGYAAPEQYGGQGQSDPRTDIYCLGATLYHLVTGLKPSVPLYEMRPIRSMNPSLSAGLEHIITKCTRRDPVNRYQSCMELMRDLERCGETDVLAGHGRAEADCPETADVRIKKRRKRLGMVAASLAVVVCLTFSGVALWANFGGNNRDGNGGDGDVGNIAAQNEALQGSNASAGTAADVNIPQASDEDCFVWKGTIITGLTEKGKQESNLVIPIKATDINAGVSYGVSIIAKNENLKTIAFQNPDIRLANGALSECTSLVKVNLPDNLQEIPDKLFTGCTALTEVSIPQNVAKIGGSAFVGCTSLQKVTHGNTIERIGHYAFKGCLSLKEFEFSSSIKTIGDQAFSGCKSLENVQFNSGLSVIGNYAFYECEKITSLVIPEGVLEIGYTAFGGCFRITQVQLLESLTNIGMGAFKNEDIITFRIKKDSYADKHFPTLLDPSYGKNSDKKEYY